jgi:periplasmic divalent cation tolerance protein
MNSVVVIETTFSHREEGSKMASLLIERHLCACCHLIDISSCFRYEGKIEKTNEVLLRCKTTVQAKEAAIDCIVSHHSYSIPEIIVTEASCPHAAYAAWVKSEVGGT